MTSLRLRRLLSPRSPLPYVALTAAGVAFWWDVIAGGINSQKSHSGIFKAVMYHLRHDDKAAQLLGSNIHYDGERHAKVEGFVNMMKGRADITFPVEGSAGLGAVRYRGRRTGNADEWASEIFTVTKDADVLSLKDD
ncbi:hypothetical protein HK104_001421 [Borealophlyctis nickersoniae]|nr:hypothetical protein HK104_001421 [Borealophlyctis nickersoniae]